MEIPTKMEVCPMTQPKPHLLLDIRERPNGSVVVKRYPFESVFDKDEWKELCEYCASHSSAQPEQQWIDAVIEDLINWIRIEDEDSDHTPWTFKEIERVIRAYKKQIALLQEPRAKPREGRK